MRRRPPASPQPAPAPTRAGSSETLWLGRLSRRQVREGIFLLIGLFTPVGVLVVNGSAYVMQHLDQFRVTLAVSAFISNIFLQGLAVYAALRHASRRWPALYDEYRRIVIVLAGIGVIAWSAFGAWGTYVSMQHARLLPNAPAVLISVWLLLLPIVTIVIGRWLGKRKAPRYPGGL